jgi:hypothetical protein
MVVLSVLVKAKDRNFVADVPMLSWAAVMNNQYFRSWL